MGRANPRAIRVQIQIIVTKQTYIFSPDTSCLGYSVKCQTMGVLEIIWAQRHTASCMSRHYCRWLLGVFCPPKRSHKRARALSLVPGYHSFPKWAIYARYVCAAVKSKGYYFLLGKPVIDAHKKKDRMGKDSGV